jgi:hypothetical protein
MSTSMQQLKQVETDIAVLQVKFANIDEKISEIKSDLANIRDDIKESSENSSALIKEFQADNVKAHEKMASKISSLERWKWMIMGAGVIIGFLGNFVANVLL